MDANMVELLKTENLAFKRKLQSKSEALHILQTQLMNLQHELDHQRSRSRNNSSSQQNYSPNQQNYSPNQQNHFFSQHNDNGSQNPSKNNLEIANRKLMDENKLLMFDIEDLKQKLNDTNNDLTMLRKQQSMMRNANHVVEKVPNNPTSLENLEQLEHLNRKYLQLEQDLQILLDEKQDLIKQRDIYYDKMQRLNIQIKNLLNISNQNVDFDAIVMENKYLKQRLEDVLNEKKLWNKTVTKYKTMLNNNCQNTGKILSYDQIAKHINSMTSSIALTKQKQPQDQTNLKQICITLLETLTEKNLLLQHQRKTNKLLAQRILELEKQNGPNVNTCDVLLRGYSATGGDAEMMVEIEEEQKSPRDANMNKTEDKDINNKTSDTQEDDKLENMTMETIQKSMKEQDKNKSIDRQKDLDDDREHQITVGYNLINSHEGNVIIVNNHDKTENVKIMGGIVHSIGDTKDILDKHLHENIKNLNHSECGVKEKCKEQIENDNNKAIDSNRPRGNISGVTSPQLHQHEDNTVNDKITQETKDLDENISFEDHEDIQSLPLELQKLVLQAMKDLEQDEIKSV
uniref:Coiled-coil domain-containing protein 149-B n=1 Tax=Cacopsylla melanoneura TaxID=428564 RepID=A0A8D8M021_9HEMI